MCWSDSEAGWIVNIRTHSVLWGATSGPSGSLPAGCCSPWVPRWDTHRQPTLSAWRSAPPDLLPSPLPSVLNAAGSSLTTCLFPRTSCPLYFSSWHYYHLIVISFSLFFPHWDKLHKTGNLIHISLGPYHLEKGWAQFLCKCPHSKSSQLRGSVCGDHSTPQLEHSSNIARDGLAKWMPCGYVLIKLYL